MQVRTLLAIGLAIALAGCGGDNNPTGPNNPNNPSNPKNNSVDGTFQATLTGSVQSTYAGIAVWGQVQDNLDFALALTDTAQGTIMFEQQNGGTISAGTYPLADASTGSVPADGTVGIVLSSPGGTAQGEFFSKSGSLTITSVSSDELKGNFQFVADGITGSGEGEVTVSGSFDAKSGVVATPSTRITRGGPGA